MRALLCVAALALAACQTADIEPDYSPIVSDDYQLIDLTDEFSAFYDRAKDLPPRQQLARFQSDIVPLYRQFYGRERFAEWSDERYEQRILREIERFPRYRSAYEAKSAQFEAMLLPAFASFREAFPDARPVGDIYLLNSLGEMDGGTRMIDSGIFLIFGADVMAQMHPYDDEEPFFHHELFHTYHDEYFGDCGQVWCALWIEGLAVYVSKTLNEDTTDEQLLLTVPEPIPAAVDANLREAVCEVRARLDSSEESDMRALFSFDRLNERLPPRFGYYVGYLAAREAGRTHSVRDLAKLSREPVRPILEAALAQLAMCPA